jgi:hypothetical protein
MLVGMETAEDSHPVRLIKAVGSIAGVPVRLTTDPIIIGTNNALSVNAPGACTAGRGRGGGGKAIHIATRCALLNSVVGGVQRQALSDSTRKAHGDSCFAGIPSRFTTDKPSPIDSPTVS